MLPLHLRALTVLQYVLAVLLGASYDLAAALARVVAAHLSPHERVTTEHELLTKRETFYERHLFGRIRDCWHRPLASSPGAWVTVHLPSGATIDCLNLSSYNYLGYGGVVAAHCDAVVRALWAHGVVSCAPRSTLGSAPVHAQLELEIAAFVGHEAALVCGMGFATNSTVLPALVGRGDLLVSDALNHTSIVVGARLSGAKVAVFAHNDMAALERVLRAAVLGRAFARIVIAVEGCVVFMAFNMHVRLCTASMHPRVHLA